MLASSYSCASWAKFCFTYSLKASSSLIFSVWLTIASLHHAYSVPIKLNAELRLLVDKVLLVKLSQFLSRNLSHQLNRRMAFLEHQVSRADVLPKPLSFFRHRLGRLSQLRDRALLQVLEFLFAQLADVLVELTQEVLDQLVHLFRDFFGTLNQQDGSVHAAKILELHRYHIPQLQVSPQTVIRLLIEDWLQDLHISVVLLGSRADLVIVQGGLE